MKNKEKARLIQEWVSQWVSEMVRDSRCNSIPRSVDIAFTSSFLSYLNLFVWQPFNGLGMDPAWAYAAPAADIGLPQLQWEAVRGSKRKGQTVTVTVSESSEGMLWKRERKKAKWRRVDRQEILMKKSGWWRRWRWTSVSNGEKKELRVF